MRTVIFVGEGKVNNCAKLRDHLVVLVDRVSSILLSDAICFFP